MLCASWEDRGAACDLYASCLRCPLPVCRYEVSGGATAILRGGRDASILAAAKRPGTTIDDLARTFGLSRRTIFRVLERHRGKRRREVSDAGEMDEAEAETQTNSRGQARDRNPGIRSDHRILS